MKILGFNITREKRSLENPAIPLSSPQAAALLFGDAFTSTSGEPVSVERALGVPAVWGAVNFLGNTIATLPLKVYRRTADGAELASGLPVYRLLHDAPNDELTSHAWRKRTMTSVLTLGRGLTFIERSTSGQVLNLWPLELEAVTIRRQQGRTTYEVHGETLGGLENATYDASEIIDLSFMLAGDGVAHRSPVHTLRNAIGLAIALESYASRFFQSGGVPPLQMTGPFTSPEGAARASFDVAEAIRKARETGKNVLPLPLGHELKQIGFEPEKGQLVEARRMQIEEIARVFGLPPVFIQDLTRATFSNAEQQDLHLVKHTIGHWVKALEQEINLKLFGVGSPLFAEFALDGLLRGDFASRMSGYATAVQNGVRTPDEVRALENLPPKGGNADRLMIQGATVPLDTAGIQPEAPAPASAPDPEPEEQEEEDDDEA